MSDISCESSAEQMIHMKCQALFLKKNIIKLSIATILNATLRVNTYANS